MLGYDSNSSCSCWAKEVVVVVVVVASIKCILSIKAL
jgi:hypothetical protein